MLIMTRKTGEAMEIAREITVKVLEIRGQRVKLGIVAPDGTVVDRLEVAVRKRAERIRRRIQPSFKTFRPVA